MLAGVYQATKKDGSIYYRSGITYKSKHISLGSYTSEADAHTAYLDASALISDPDIDLSHLFSRKGTLSFSKAVSLLNFRDKDIYIKNPIYLFNNYFVYFIDENLELKFDIDDLFYYSNHKIIKRGGHLYVNDYGSQMNLVTRYGIKNYGVVGKDYEFLNGDPTDFRYGNIRILNEYYGVTRIEKDGKVFYRSRLHLNGNYTIGTYATPEEAAIAYNKALDYLRDQGLSRNFPDNYVDLPPRKYADLYSEIKISKSIRDYMHT